MEHHEQQSDRAPACLQPMLVPRDFVRQVSRPDDQVLREGEVRPQHHERQREIAGVVKMIGDDDLIERGTAAQPDDREDQECDRRQSLAADDQHAINGRIPVGFERHQPVERGEGEGEDAGHQRDGRHLPQAEAERGITRLVLLQRERAQPKQ